MGVQEDSETATQIARKGTGSQAGGEHKGASGPLLQRWEGGAMYLGGVDM